MVIKCQPSCTNECSIFQHYNQQAISKSYIAILVFACFSCSVLISSAYMYIDMPARLQAFHQSWPWFHLRHLLLPPATKVVFVLCGVTLQPYSWPFQECQANQRHAYKHNNQISSLKHWNSVNVYGFSVLWTCIINWYMYTVVDKSNTDRKYEQETNHFVWK